MNTGVATKYVLMFCCFESKYGKMLGFLIVVSSYEAGRVMDSPDPYDSAKSKEQRKRHPIPTYNFSPSPISSKDGCIERSAGLHLGKRGPGPVLDLCGIWTITLILWALISPSRAKRVEMIR